MWHGTFHTPLRARRVTIPACALLPCATGMLRRRLNAFHSTNRTINERTHVRMCVWHPFLHFPPPPPAINTGLATAFTTFVYYLHRAMEAVYCDSSYNYRLHLKYMPLVPVRV